MKRYNNEIEDELHREWCGGLGAGVLVTLLFVVAIIVVAWVFQVCR